MDIEDILLKMYSYSIYNQLTCIKFIVTLDNSTEFKIIYRMTSLLTF